LDAANPAQSITKEAHMVASFFAEKLKTQSFSSIEA
jgi:hypothetical protein